MAPRGPRNPGIAQAGPFPRPAALLARFRDERGVVSANELLVAALIMLPVMLSVFVLYNQAVKGQTRTENRVQGLQQQQVGLEKMQRELRQAVSVTPISSQVVEMETYATPSGGSSAVQRHVRYECDTTCSRFEGPSGGTTYSAGPIPIITSVENVNVFSFEPDYINPNFVALEVNVTVDGMDRPLRLSGGVALKNLARNN